jgi:hypothetical protein
MFVRIHTGLLVFMLLHAPLALADDTIRFSIEDGKKRAEFKLNGNMECILENDRISCVPTSK